MVQSKKVNDVVINMTDVWAQIDPTLLDDIYKEENSANEQDGNVLQKIKSDVLKQIGNEKLPRVKPLIYGYVKFTLMAAAVVVLIGMSWLLAYLLPSNGISPTITANTHLNPTGATQATQTAQMTAKATYASQSTTRPALSPGMVVRSDKYQDLASYKSPEQGHVLLTLGLRNAIDDLANKNSVFFINIALIPPEHYTNPLEKYVFNGRTIAEWRILVDLSNGTYPYNEYNGDRGGNITRDEWIKAQEEARTLDAQKNCDAAIAEYQTNVWPTISEAYRQVTVNEIERLSQLGYDVFPFRTWSYSGPSREKQSVTIVAGLLTKEQLLHFPASGNYGYMIDWVHNGDGIVNWGVDK